MASTLGRVAEAALDSILVRPARKIRTLQKILRHAAKGIPLDLGPAYCNEAKYNRMREVFINNGKHSRYDERVRAEVVKAFERIHREVRTVSTPTDALFLAEVILSLECEGAIIECGCFNGGSTAKLSVLAKHVGRELVVFDSFEGLPMVGPHELRDYHARGDRYLVRDWSPGRYAAGLELVRANVEQYGEISACTFHKGWFKDTLNETNLPARVALAFTDVDVASSARQCLVSLWPRLSEGGVFFSHDIAFLKVLQVFSDDHTWREVLREPVPIIFGAGYGLSDASPHLGFLVKGREVTAEYLKRLTFEK